MMLLPPFPPTGTAEKDIGETTSCRVVACTKKTRESIVYSAPLSRENDLDFVVVVCMYSQMKCMQGRGT